MQTSNDEVFEESPLEAAPPDVSSLGQDEESEAFEHAVARLAKTVNQAPLHREIFLRLIEFCKSRQSLANAEQAVAAMPEFATVSQSPYRLIRTLVDAEGLYWIEIGKDGTVLTPSDKAGLTDDEIQDITFEYAVKATPVGEQVADDLTPEKRLGDLFAHAPGRVKAFKDVMGFCRESRTFAEINAFLRARSGDTLATTSSQTLNPSYYVDMLERAGVLVWNQGWKLTGRGAKALQVIA